MSEFFVGQQVVCINDAHHASNADAITDTDGWPLVKGHIFTVRGLVWVDDTHGLPGLSLHLVEDARGPCFCCGNIIPFHSSRFRPLEAKSIEVFRKIARDVTEGRKVEFVE